MQFNILTNLKNILAQIKKLEIIENNEPIKGIKNYKKPRFQFYAFL